MAKARDIYRRIKSVESTKKITRTMEMVAASKLRRAQDRVFKARPYADRLGSIIENLITPELSELQPYLRQPDRIRRAAVRSGVPVARRRMGLPIAATRRVAAPKKVRVFCIIVAVGSSICVQLEPAT